MVYPSTIQIVEVGDVRWLLRFISQEWVMAAGRCLIATLTRLIIKNKCSDVKQRFDVYRLNGFLQDTLVLVMGFYSPTVWA
jgi:hypothetical protein